MTKNLAVSLQCAKLQRQYSVSKNFAFTPKRRNIKNSSRVRRDKKKFENHCPRLSQLVSRKFIFCCVIKLQLFANSRYQLIS